MDKYKPSGITWDLAHRRNMTLTQINLFSDGLEGKGYYPGVRFSRHNYLAVCSPGEGAYLFYDRDELEKNTAAFQKDIDSGRCTPIRLRKLSRKFFDDVISASLEFKKRDLSELSNGDLLALFNNFRKAMTVGPIITVQLWGIESCWDPDYKLAKFLREKVAKLGKEMNYQECVEILSASRRKTVPVLERESFLRVAIGIKRNKALVGAFETSPECADLALLKFPDIGKMLDCHIGKFAWATSEYQSQPWNRRQWLEAFRAGIASDCRKELDSLELKYKNSLKEKKKLLKRLYPPSEIRRILDVLEEFISQRDWAKGKYSEAYLNWRPLVDELSRRAGCKGDEVLFLTLDEIKAFLSEGSLVPMDEIRRRKRGFAAISLGNPFIVISKDVEKVIRSEKVYSQLYSSKHPSVVRGTIGSGGFARGNARVVRYPKDIGSVNNGDILVTYMTTMEFTPVFRKVRAVVTDEGGLSSHAAIVSREFGIPCIVGTKNATMVLKTGDYIEVDAEKGIVRKVGK